MVTSIWLQSACSTGALFLLCTGTSHCWAALYMCQEMSPHSCSNPKPTDPKTDHRWMLNVTSSASVNVPPPNGLVTAMNKTNHAGKIDSKTRVRHRI